MVILNFWISQRWGGNLYHIYRQFPWESASDRI